MISFQRAVGWCKTVASPAETRHGVGIPKFSRYTRLPPLQVRVGVCQQEWYRGSEVFRLFKMKDFFNREK